MAKFASIRKSLDETRKQGERISEVVLKIGAPIEADDNKKKK